MATALLSLVALLGSPTPIADAGSDVPEPVPGTTIPNDFLPESANLSDCVGFVERPGCGAEGRGGTGQTLAFFGLAAGLGVIVWRITVGVRRNRAADQPQR